MFASPLWQTKEGLIPLTPFDVGVSKQGEAWDMRWDDVNKAVFIISIQQTVELDERQIEPGWTYYYNLEILFQILAVHLD